MLVNLAGHQAAAYRVEEEYDNRRWRECPP